MARKKPTIDDHITKLDKQLSALRFKIDKEHQLAKDAMKRGNTNMVRQHLKLKGLLLSQHENIIDQKLKLETMKVEVDTIKSNNETKKNVWEI